MRVIIERTEASQWRILRAEDSADGCTIQAPIGLVHKVVGLTDHYSCARVSWDKGPPLFTETEKWYPSINEAVIALLTKGQ